MPPLLCIRLAMTLRHPKTLEWGFQHRNPFNEEVSGRLLSWQFSMQECHILSRDLLFHIAARLLLVLFVNRHELRSASFRYV